MEGHGWYDAPQIDFKKWRETVINAQLEVQACGFEANIIENHDEPRGVSRFLPKYAQTPAGTKMLGTVSLLLRGIPFIYQGQEIGMQRNGTVSMNLTISAPRISIKLQEKQGLPMRKRWRHVEG